MKRAITATAAGLALALGLGGCLTDSGQKETAGGLIGAALGGIAGSQIGDGDGQLVAVGVGAVLGALMGSEVGRSLDKADELHAARNYQQALETAPTGQTSTWENPDTGHSGTHTPTRTYQSETGQYCREFQQTVTIGGRTEEAYGQACREEDGAWRIVNG